MQYELINLDIFAVAGTEIVTSNSESRFCNVWSEFLKSYRGGQLVAAYTDYESNEYGKFTFMVGVKSENDKSSKVFNGGKYLKFHLEDKAQILACWQYIWSNNFDRTYIADFEFYNNDGSVNVCIGIRE